MQLNRDLILDTALAILAAYGLADLTMRRIAKALDVAPGALYWHFPNKQALLGAVAGRICADLPTPDALLTPSSDDATGQARSHTTSTRLSADSQDSADSANATTTSATIYCHALYDCLTSTRDGAEIVLAAMASDTIDRDPRSELVHLAGPTGGEILLHYVFGAALDFQAQRAQELATGRSVNTTGNTASPGVASPGQDLIREEATRRLHDGIQLMINLLTL